MTLREFINKLEQNLVNNPENATREVFVECSDSGGSWSPDGLGLSDNKIVLTLDKYDGPQTPDNQICF